MKALWAMALLVGCQAGTTEHEGIAVGNPGLASLSLAVSDGATLDSAAGRIASARFAGADCGGDDRASTLAQDVDLADGPASFDFPAGRWCGLILDLSGPLVLAGTWSEGAASGPLSATLDLGAVPLGAVDDALEVAEESELAFELGAPGWLDGSLADLADGEALEIDADSPEHDPLVAALRGDSGLFDDVDGDGVVARAERDLGPLAVARELRWEEVPAAAVRTDSGDSACAVTGRGSGGGWLGLGLLLLFGRRRRASWLGSPGG